MICDRLCHLHMAKAGTFQCDKAGTTLDVCTMLETILLLVSTLGREARYVCVFRGFEIKNTCLCYSECFHVYLTHIVQQ